MLATDGLLDNVFDEEVEAIVQQQLKELAAMGRGKQQAANTPASATVGAGAEASASTSAQAQGQQQQGSVGTGSSGSGGAGGGGRKTGAGLLSQSLNLGAAGGRGGGSAYRPEDAVRVARALAERAHQHARNPTQRTPWSVTSSQQPNFMWAKFFAKGGCCWDAGVGLEGMGYGIGGGGVGYEEGAFAGLRTCSGAVHLALAAIAVIAGAERRLACLDI